MFSNACFVSSIEFFSSRRIYVWFFFGVPISLIKYSFWSQILFLSFLNCVSAFPCISLNFFVIPILYSLSVRLQYSVTVYLVYEELSFSFHDIMLPWFFVVLDEFFLCWYLWSNKHFSSVGKNVLLDSSNSRLAITGLSFYFSVDGNVAQDFNFFTWAASGYFWGLAHFTFHCLC